MLAQLDPDLLAPAIEGAGGDPVLRSRLLHWLTAADRLQGGVEVVLGPSCCHSVKWLSKLDPFFSCDLVKSRAGDFVNLGRLVGRDLLSPQGIESTLQVLVGPILASCVLLWCWDAHPVGSLPQRGWGDAVHF